MRNILFIITLFGCTTKVIHVHHHKTYAVPCNVTNIPTDLNNPGCLTRGNPTLDSMAIGSYSTSTHTFLVFPDSATGFKALYKRIKQSDDEPYGSFINRYIGEPGYATALRNKLGVKNSTKLKFINTDSLVKYISTYEGFKHGTNLCIEVL